MKKLSKNKDQLLRFLSTKMPNDSYVVNSRATISGDDLLLTGVRGDISKEKEYVISNTEFHAINHYKRLKKASKRKGLDGVIDYLRKYFKLESRLETLIKEAWA